MSSELGIGWIVGTVLAGIALCIPMARRTRWEAVRMLMFGVFLIVVLPFGWTRSSPEALRAQLAEMRLDSLQDSDWDEAAALDGALRLTGGALPDLSMVTAHLDRAIDARTLSNPIDLVEALQMGLIDETHRRKLAEFPDVRSRLDEVRSGSRSLHYLRFDRYLIDLLKDDARHDSALRARLAEQLESEWPEPGEYGALEDAWLCVQGLDSLGEKDRANAFGERANHLLVSHWISGSVGLFGKLGGFTPDPVELRSSFEDETWYAVQLMARFGAPAEIDLRLLRGYLRGESYAMPIDRDSRHAEARASLRVLEDCIGMPVRDGLQRILDERLLLAVALLVALCLTAIRLAPSPDSREQAGARP